MVLAAHHGYHKILKIFTEKLSETELTGLMVLSDEYHGKRTILHEIVRQNSVKLRTGKTENMDYQECLKIMLDENKGRARALSLAKHTERIINFRDSSGETALHYATQQPDQGIIKLLLKHGANMGVKNNEEKAPVARILPDTLEEFFNECLQSDGIITDDKFKLTFNYNFLAPPLLDAEILEDFETKAKDPEDSDVRNPRPETEALWYMSESNQHRPLLKHPLISSFLWMKWQRIRSFYYLGVVSYFIFVFLVTTMIMFEYGGCSIKPVENCSDMDTSVLKVLIGICLVFLLGLELIQVFVSFKRYVASAENIVQNFIIILTAVLIMDSSLEFNNKRHLAALLLVLTWMEFLIFFGTHPNFNTKVFMFYSVASSFCKFLLWYVFVIIAFALSFYIMFHNDYEDGVRNEDYPFFEDIGSW